MKNAEENSLVNKEHPRLWSNSDHHTLADRNLLERYEYRAVSVHQLVTIGRHTVGLQDYTYTCNDFKVTRAKPFPQYANNSHTHTVQRRSHLPGTKENALLIPTTQSAQHTRYVTTIVYICCFSGRSNIPHSTFNML